MPPWLPRAVLIVLALLACYQFAHWVFSRLVGLLVNILISFFCAVAIEPAVDWMARRHVRRGLATGIVLLVVFVAAAGFVLALGTLLVDQIRMIVENLPRYADDVIRWVNRTFHTHFKTGNLQNKVLHSNWVRTYLSHGASNVWGISTTIFGTVFQLFTVLLFTYYLAADGPRLRRTLCSMLPPARQAEVLRAWDLAVAKTGGYLYSRALMAVISGVAHYIILQVLGVPYAPALAVWVGVVSQFVPTVGTYLAGALPVLIAFTRDPWDALWVLCFVVIYQQFENYILQPRITARTVDIHPAVAFGSVVAGTALLGAVGALVAIPATATLQGFFATYVRRYEVSDERP
ncbi:AI-2E family transporter [Streptomyces sp. PLK6-54]|uniref:AI-2E family transporter n=2 Tax=Actinacidiphila acidipaludis TaxID=2873382 RepID=A0ABS7QH07_9ACTN|nr:AI-2E family transporter [Streptomyces acidipaludis]